MKECSEGTTGLVGPVFNEVVKVLPAILVWDGDVRFDDQNDNPLVRSRNPTAEVSNSIRSVMDLRLEKGRIESSLERIRTF